jgi:hypothetical protein
MFYNNFNGCRAGTQLTCRYIFNQKFCNGDIYIYIYIYDFDFDFDYNC